MADTKVSALPTVTTLAGSDKVMAVASGNSRAITKTNLAATLNAGVSAITNGDATVFNSTTASGSGVVTLSIVAGGIPVAKGGTGATSASGARTNLGLTDNATKVHNFAASAVPTVNDDSGDGYSVGSVWVVTSGGSTGKIFQATDVSLGAAVWKELLPVSTVTAKGQIIAGTASAAVSPLTVGANDTLLVADSAQATGLKYQKVRPQNIENELCTVTALTNANVTLTPFTSDTYQKFTGTLTGPVIIILDTTGAVEGQKFYIGAQEVIANSTNYFEIRNATSGGTLLWKFNPTQSVTIDSCIKVIFDGTAWVVMDDGHSSYGEAYMTNNATITSISGSTTPTKIAGTTTAGALYNFTHSDNRLTCAKTGTHDYELSANLSLLPDSGVNQSVAVYFARNGTVIAKSEQRRLLANTSDYGTISIGCLVTLASGDYVETWVENYTSANDIVCTHLNMRIMEVQ